MAATKTRNSEDFVNEAKNKGIKVEYSKDGIAFHVSYSANIKSIDLNKVKTQIDNAVPILLDKSEMPAEGKQDIEVNIRWKPALGDVVLFKLSTPQIRLYGRGNLYDNEDVVAAFDGILKMKKEVDLVFMPKTAKS